MPKNQTAIDGKGRAVKKIGSEGGSVFDFSRVQNFAKNYLKTYYSDGLTADEESIIRTLVNYLPLAAGSRFLEIGCGPTLHHAIPAAEHFKEIHMADFLEENLEEIQLWKEGAASAHDWSQHTAFTLSEEGKEGTESNIRERDELLRERLTAFLRIDLKKDPQPGIIPYPAVGCFYCTEEIGITKAEWAKVVSRVAAYVAPGGYLFLSSLRGSSFYAVLNADGTTRHLPCASVTEDDYQTLLPELGFDMSQTHIEGIVQRGQETEGIYGVVIVVAKKKE